MHLSLKAFSILVATAPAAFAATFEPAPIQASNLVLQIEEVGLVQPAAANNNIASPVAIDNDLYAVDQRGRILLRDGAGFQEVFNITNAPAGLTPVGNEAILNMAGRGDQVYVSFESSTLPPGMTAAPLPNDPVYETGRFEVIYSFTRNPDGTLSDPQALTAFENAPSSHTGGGMLVLPDGQLVYARGDNLRFDRDGLSAPQDDTSNVGRIFLIDGDTGDTEVAAQGIRNVQRLAFVDGAESQIGFVDMGAETAEEVNVISVSDLADTSTVENFGWGRNADGNAREGTFYINDGATSNPGTRPEAIADAPVGEFGFVQPYAQFGNDLDALRFAGSGPVWSDDFVNIDLLFGDLVSGALYATMTGGGNLLNDVFSVRLVDINGAAVVLSDFNGGGRVDLRFFNFADGGAGLLLEKTGQIFRLTELVAPVPLPASGLMLMGGLALLRLRRG